MKRATIIIGIVIVVAYLGYVVSVAIPLLIEHNEVQEDIKSDVLIEVGNAYNTENITLLKELEDEKEYLKYELLVEDKIKQVIYIKDTSEVVIIE